MSGVFLNLSAAAAPAKTRLHPTFTIRVTTDVVPVQPKRAEAEPRQILRFQRSERLLHWSIAIPFMVCYTTAVILFLFFNLHSPGYARHVWSWAHRIAGAGLIAFPLLTAIRNPRDYRLHLDNIRQAWSWALDDLKWLVLMGAAAISNRVQLPEQGKFNAAEKLNFMMVMSTYPVFLVTGVLLWIPDLHFLSWLTHVGLAILATPLMLGHIYMALINPGTRVGLGGMTTGYVDRQWAKHHYQRWYRANFETSRAGGDGRSEIEVLQRPALIHCHACFAEHLVASWVRVIETVLEIQPLKCPHCGAEADPVSVLVEPDEAIPVLRALGQAGIHGLDVERSADGRTYVPQVTPRIELRENTRRATRESRLELQAEEDYPPSAEEEVPGKTRR
jgi:formate dehydrogenase subunit gamma